MNRAILVGIVIGLCLSVSYAAETQAETAVRLNPDDFICFPADAATEIAITKEGATFTRILSGSDAGCEFHPNGEDIPLDFAHGRIELQPIRSINRGYYVITITFRGTHNRWAEKDWIRDIGEPRSIKPQVLPDVLKFAKDKGITGMDRYFLKIRIQPHAFEKKRPAFVFSSISIGPVQ